MIADRNIDRNKLSRFIDRGFDFFSSQLEKHKITINDYVEKLSKKGTIAYIENDREIIGAVIGYTHDTPDNSSYITQVYVLPEYRGNGLVNSLLNEYCNFCMENKLDKVWLTTKKDNLSAQRAYKKAGFSEDKTYENKDLIKFVMEVL